jgi:transposase-like protein
MDKQKVKCEYCHSKTRKTKPYIIADNLEEPRWLCKTCKKALDMEVMLKLPGIE